MPWKVNPVSQIRQAFVLQVRNLQAPVAVAARNSGRGFPTPDGYIAAIAASRGYIVASRDTSPYEAGGLRVIDPWQN